MLMYSIDHVNDGQLRFSLHFLYLSWIYRHGGVPRHRCWMNLRRRLVHGLFASNIDSQVMLCLLYEALTALYDDVGVIGLRRALILRSTLPLLTRSALRYRPGINRPDAHGVAVQRLGVASLAIMKHFLCSVELGQICGL